MENPRKLLKNIEKWAKNQPDLRTLILLGSHVHKGHTDRLSDIDLYLFVENLNNYKENQDWFKVFGPVWLAVLNDESDYVGWKVIYEGGLLVEFFMYPITALETMRDKLPEHFEPGYDILVDKDRRAKQLPQASETTQPPESPSVEMFQKSLASFWLNAYHVAKYLWRRDLWRAKHHDWRLKDDLLQMMSWHAVLKGKQQTFTAYEGKGLQTWIEPETFTSLMTVFGRFYPADSWRALEDTIKLFTQLSSEIAEILGTDISDDLQKKFMPLIKDLQTNPPD